MSYLDVNHGTVVSAAKNTSGTGDSWTAWASQAQSCYQEVSGLVCDATVTGAIEGYASVWNPKMGSMATQVDNLGRNTAGAANVVYNADGTSTVLVKDTGYQIQDSGSNLTRPITA